MVIMMLKKLRENFNSMKKEHGDHENESVQVEGSEVAAE